MAETNFDAVAGALNSKISKYSGTGNVPGSDFNTMTETGIYTMTSNINSPVSGNYFYGMMLVMAGLYGYITQFAIATSGDIYCRTFNGTTWESWKHITAT